MTETMLIEKIAAGLRAMTTPPDAILYAKDLDSPLIFESICGIPILVTAFIRSESETDFIPLFRNQEISAWNERKLFEEGFLS